MAEFKMLHDFDGVGSRCGHEEAVSGKARGGSVIHDETVFAQHGAVARATNGEC